MTIKYRNQLPEFMKELGLPMVGAELGVAEGLFTCDLLRGGIKLLYLVDNWGHIEGAFGDGANTEEWHMKNMNAALERVSQTKDIEAEVEILRGISWEQAYKVSNNSLGLLYLDGCHTYECVKKDLEAWFPKVRNGGIIAGHDYLNRSYGVHQAVGEFCAGKYEVTTITENKDEDAGFYFIKK